MKVQIGGSMPPIPNSRPVELRACNRLYLLLFADGLVKSLGSCECPTIWRKALPWLQTDSGLRASAVTPRPVIPCLPHYVASARS